MANRPSFFANDALIYVENYNRLLIKNLEQIAQLKIEFESKFSDSSTNDHIYYAKLRAFEHAIEYKETGRAPEGMVFIGDAPAEQKSPASIDKDKEKTKALASNARQFSDAVKNMQSELKKGQARELSLKDEIIQREQAIKRIQRQMTNTQGSYALLIGTIIIAVALAFWL